MLRFWFVIIISLPFILLYYAMSAFIELSGKPYDEEERYRLARKVVSTLKTNAFVSTDVFGTENLPEDGGYVMYANHQGKYDAVGIIYGHDTPCTILMDKKRSQMPLMNEFLYLLRGSRLDKDDMRSQVRTILSVAKQVEEGRRYIIFPEGGYGQNMNHVGEFLPGAFKCSTKSRTPIVPVVLVDSYKPFSVNSLRPVKTQVHFLKPIQHEEYKNLPTERIADMVRTRIVEKINELDLPVAEMQTSMSASDGTLSG